jgi:hypothetical protein
VAIIAGAFNKKKFFEILPQNIFFPKIDSCLSKNVFLVFFSSKIDIGDCPLARKIEYPFQLSKS